MVKKIGILIVTSLVVFGFGAIAHAQSEMIADGLNTDLAPLATESVTESEFYHEDEDLGKVKLPERPECESAALYAKTMQEVEKYIGKINADTTLSKRSKALISANIDGFHQVAAQNFLPEQDLNTANALVMIKINDKIDENDILLCRQNRDVPHPVYLIIYPYADNYRVYVINLDQSSSDYRDVTFIFP